MVCYSRKCTGTSVLDPITSRMSFWQNLCTKSTLFCSPQFVWTALTRSSSYNTAAILNHFMVAVCAVFTPLDCATQSIKQDSKHKLFSPLFCLQLTVSLLVLSTNHTTFYSLVYCCYAAQYFLTFPHFLIPNHNQFPPPPYLSHVFTKSTKHQNICSQILTNNCFDNYNRQECPLPLTNFKSISPL